MASRDRAPFQSRFLELPAEIREEIYRFILRPSNNRHELQDEHAYYSFSSALVLFRINRQIYAESLKIFRDLNIFIRIKTPWPEAHYHVAREGHVPIVCVDRKAVDFTGHSLFVSIHAPHAPIDIKDEQQWIIMLDDLERFTETWYYSDLSHNINQYLRLTLSLRDTHAPRVGGDQPRISKQLQRRLLLPFKMVKGLQAMEFGRLPSPFGSILEELRAAQAEPPPSPEQCLTTAVQYKQKGNVEMHARRYESALTCYRKAWHAIHVVFRGRERYIHGDRIFARVLHDPPFQGKNGQAERLLLRVQLVANTCLAYLNMRQYEDCEYWGLRAINIMREALGADEIHQIRPEDEARLEFPASDQMGKVYYRTAVASKNLGRTVGAHRLLQVATIYLPHDKTIKEELAACASALG